MKAKILFTLGFIILHSAFLLSSQAQFSAFTYQGRLNSSNGEASGTYDLTFGLFNAASGGGQISFTQTNSLVLSNGLFTVTLDFGPQFYGLDRWLEIGVRTNGGGAFSLLSPRQKVMPTPYALYALAANTATIAASASADAIGQPALQSSSVNSDKIADGTITTADLSSALASNTFWRFNGNAGTTAGTHFLGTTDNQPLEFKVNGQLALRLEPTAGAVNFIGGTSNTILAGATGATIGGGSGNTNGSAHSVIAGGFNNTAQPGTGLSAIGGGWLNTIQSGADESVIAGGNAGTIQSGARESFIGGGFANTMLTNAAGSFIGGGAFNTNGGAYATVGGGQFNSGGGYAATVPGGVGNTAAGNYSFAAGRNAKALHDGSFVWNDSAGDNFTSTANNQFLIHATGGAGIGTTNPQALLNVDGTTRIDATPASYNEGLTLNLPTDMPGGGFGGLHFHNAARGAPYGSATIKWGIFYNYAPELGITGRGLSFVQNNVNTRLYVSTNGNVGIGTTNPTNKLHVEGGVSATAFVNTSDRNAKENFSAVSAREVLAKVAALPIWTWNFKELHDGRHMGPVAQDFYAAFGLGGSDTTITTVDPDGVALAAIQGLNQKVEAGGQRSEVRIQKLEAENAELKQTVNELKQLVGSLADKLNGSTK